MTNPVNVAVVGATGAVGGMIVELLAERQFPLNELFLLASDNSAGTSVKFKNRKILVHDLAEFDFSQVQLAFFAVPESVAAEKVPDATASECVVIDNSAYFRNEIDTPLLVIHPQDEVLSELPLSRIISSPHPAANFLSQTLKPLLAEYDIEQVNLTVFEPVSLFGKAAVEELGGQAVALLNMREISPARLPFQVLFNLSPMPGGRDSDGFCEDEKQVIVETKKILGSADMAINVSASLVPVFYGVGLSVQVLCKSDVKLETVKTLFSAQAGLEICVENERLPAPSALKHGSGTESVYIGNVRKVPDLNRGLNYQVYADNIKTGAALNSIYIGENLVKGVL